MNSQHNHTTVNRRHFLRLGTATVASLGSLGCTSSLFSNRPGKKIPVGAHVWVYAATQPQYDVTPVLPQIFEDLKYADLDGVELMHNVLRKRETADLIKQLSDQHELAVIGASFSGNMWDRQQHETVLEDAKRVIENLVRVNGKTLGISVGGAPQKKTNEQLDAQADLLEKILAISQAHHIEPNLHNHTYEVEDNMHDLKGTLARIPSAKLGPDLNWLVRGGVNPAWFIRHYGRQIVFLHLRDQTLDGRWSEAMGEGDMDYPEIGRALQEIDFRGYAVIELAHEANFQRTRPMRESWKISREFVRATLGY